MRRNRRHLRRVSQNTMRCSLYNDDDCNIPDVHERQQVTEQLPNNEEHLPTESTSRVSRYGRPINPPRRYIESANN